ncbi:MAG TPA: hypothetical protein VJ901_00005, partial [Thermoanaerobaculia bacterium]|nr:hypothetical protein [Thermoanaerobaculia bacterium]
MLNVVRSAAFRRPIIFVSAITTIALVMLLGAATVYAACSTTIYNVTSSSTPANGNWTDTTGTLWTPGGGFPGCAAGDSANDNTTNPTTFIVNSPIPNPIASLVMNCNGCVISIQSGGSLELDGPGTMASGTSIQLNGGTFTLGSTANLTMQSGSAISMGTGGTLSIGPSATLTLASGSQLFASGGSIDGGGKITGGGNVEIGGNVALVNGTGDVPFTIDSGATGDVTGNYTLTTN